MSKPKSGGRPKRALARAASKPSEAKPSVKRAKRAKLAADAALERVSALCLALPGTKLTMTWGSPHFRVDEKIFCGFGAEDDKLVLGVKLRPEHARRVVKQARFWPAPYVGKHGWVSMNLAERESWDEVSALIRESYELIAPKALRPKLG